jgi:AraC-like DNA-binding protein
MGHRSMAVVAALKTFVAANYNRPIRLAEICVTLDVSERTLRHYCQALLGVSPMRYVRIQRMRLAMRALRGGTPATTNVTRIATEHGFFELGRFAGEYRQLFGERPTATLNRQPVAS